MSFAVNALNALQPAPPPPGRATQLARNLVAARAAAGLTQHQLARRSRVSRATIAQIEASASDPRLSTLALLAEAMGVSPLHLLLGRRELQSLSASGDALATFAALGHTARLGAQDVADRSREIVDSASAAVGAAIGAAVQPGRGSVVVAAWAYLLERQADAPSSPDVR